MPKGHRRFLEDVAKQPNLHDFIYNHPHQGLGLAYDCTLTGLKAFREAHIQVVTRYIILPARASKQDGDLKGTAGSAIIPFLKQARDETLAQEAENLAGTSEKDQ
jgi:indoleamine 2,3-dioxygenase